MSSIATYVGYLVLSEPSQRVFAPSMTLWEGFEEEIRERNGEGGFRL